MVGCCLDWYAKHAKPAFTGECIKEYFVSILCLNIYFIANGNNSRGGTSVAHTDIICRHTKCNLPSP